VTRQRVSKPTNVGHMALPIALVFGRDRDYCSGVLRGIRRYSLGCHNWALVSIFPHSRLGESLKSLNPAGIIINCGSCPGLAGTLRKTGRPVVNVNRELTDPHFSHIYIDETSVGMAAANHLVECGLKNFGYFGPSWGGQALDREGGFCQTLRHLSYEPVFCYTRPSGTSPRGGTFASQKHIIQWVHQLPKPVGIFAPNDMWALWLCGVCKQEGVKVPDEVAIIGACNDELLCEMANPSLSSVTVPAERIGYEAAALLDGLISRESVPKEQLLFPASGVAIRQSTNILAGAEPVVASAVGFIREHFSEPISVDDLIQHARLHRRSFERKFRAALGRSPAQEIRRMRIAMAKTFLAANPHMSTESIVRCCGFSSRTQFSMAFQQVTGMALADYRRTMGQEIGMETSATGSLASQS
jgi:LacI family transcriptional regulator